jgi:hypothetical protein
MSKKHFGYNNGDHRKSVEAKSSIELLDGFSPAIKDANDEDF